MPKSQPQPRLEHSLAAAGSGTCRSAAAARGVSLAAPGTGTPQARALGEARGTSVPEEAPAVRKRCMQQTQQRAQESLIKLLRLAAAEQHKTHAVLHFFTTCQHRMKTSTHCCALHHCQSEKKRTMYLVSGCDLALPVVSGGGCRVQRSVGLSGHQQVLLLLWLHV
jgi:hypothetical protein